MLLYVTALYNKYNICASAWSPYLCFLQYVCLFDLTMQESMQSDVCSVCVLGCFVSFRYFLVCVLT